MIGHVLGYEPELHFEDPDAVRETDARACAWEEDDDELLEQTSRWAGRWLVGATEAEVDRWVDELAAEACAEVVGTGGAR